MHVLFAQNESQRKEEEACEGVSVGDSSLSQPEYFDGPVEEPENIVDEMEELLSKLHDDIDGKLKEIIVGVDEVNDGLNDPSVIVEQSNAGLNDANIGVEATNIKVELVEVEINTDGQVHDEFNSDDSGDDSYQYDSPYIHAMSTMKTQGNASQANATQGTASQTTASQVATTQASVAQDYMNVTQSSQGKSVPWQGTKEKASETGKLLKLGVRRPFVSPRATTRLSAARNAVGPTTIRSTPTKRSTSKRTI
ncbi:unnamed protein product [Vicia faba]|uniref:Uncharacterized protein n=1 Tax=Vicia faba TaxID=3906 RepID=A0AAV0Z6H6_VICFA|nr:unnamed protein product [Vicia faba]